MNKLIFDNSETIQSLAEAYDEYTEEEVINDSLEMFTSMKHIYIDSCKKLMFNILNNYESIVFTDDNILIYVHLAEYYNLNKKFTKYIVDEYILNRNKFYDILWKHETINQLILNKITNENLIIFVDEGFKLINLSLTVPQ